MARNDASLLPAYLCVAVASARRYAEMTPAASVSAASSACVTATAYCEAGGDKRVTERLMSPDNSVSSLPHPSPLAGLPLPACPVGCPFSLRCRSFERWNPDFDIYIWLRLRLRLRTSARS